MQAKDKRPAAPPFPPWGNRQEWQTINEILATTLFCLEERARLIRSAQALHGYLDTLGETMSTAAVDSCPTCTTICCLHARPFYNFQDLLYLHLAGLQPPAKGQPVLTTEGQTNHCQYLRTSGCVLKREVRPWICTWYICPDMKKLLQPQLTMVVPLIDTIKRKREELENTFIEMVLR